MPVLKVKGMTCNHCVMAVEKALRSIQGIRDIKVDLSTGQVEFKEDTPVKMDIVREKIRKAGYEIV